MSEYKATTPRHALVLQELAGLAEIAKLPGCEEINAELVDQILEQSAKFASAVLSRSTSPPTRGSKWDQGKVITPKGFKEASGSSSRQAGRAAGARRARRAGTAEGCLDAGRRDVDSRRIFLLSRHHAHRGRGRGLDPARTEDKKGSTCPKMIEGAGPAP